MKFDMSVKDLCEIHYERKPMDKERFNALLLTIGSIAGGALFVFLMTARILF